MNALRRAIMLLVVLMGLFAPGTAGSAEDPLPGSCGLPNPDTITFAFAGPELTYDVPVFDFDMKRCQSGTLDITYVLGCGSEYYAANPGHGALHLSLAQAGFHVPGATTTTLKDVLSHAGGEDHDPYLVQAVTAYLNSLYVDGYAYDVQAVLNGYHGGEISEGSFAWQNHGATSQFVVPSCPLTSSTGVTF